MPSKEIEMFHINVISPDRKCYILEQRLDGEIKKMSWKQLEGNVIDDQFYMREFKGSDVCQLLTKAEMSEFTTSIITGNMEVPEGCHKLISTSTQYGPWEVRNIQTRKDPELEIAKVQGLF